MRACESPHWEVQINCIICSASSPAERTYAQPGRSGLKINPKNSLTRLQTASKGGRLRIQAQVRIIFILKYHVTAWPHLLAIHWLHM